MTTATYTTRAILQARQPWQSRRKYKVPGHGRHWIHEADVVSWTQDRQGYGGVLVVTGTYASRMGWDREPEPIGEQLCLC